MSQKKVMLSRLQRELKFFKNDALPNSKLEPRDDNLQLLDGKMEITFENRSFPLHFLIKIPDDYPDKAPSIGFCTKFPYHGHHSGYETDSNSVLFNKFTICLDLLGNFEYLHAKEWEKAYNSGWSSAYTIVIVLNQLQNVIISHLSDPRTTRQQIEQVFTDANAYNEMVTRSESNAINNSNDLNVVTSTTAQEMPRAADASTSSSVMDILPPFPVNHDFCVDDLEARDSFGEIHCCYSKTGLGESTLGYGIKVVRHERKAWLSSDGSYLSYQNAYCMLAADKRKFPSKEPYQFFLPAWINATYATLNPKWSVVLNECLTEIRAAVASVENVYVNYKKETARLPAIQDKKAILYIIPSLILNMIVQFFEPRGKARASLLILQFIVNIWRIFRYLVDEIPGT